MKSIAIIKSLLLLTLIIPVNAFSSNVESMRLLRERVAYFKDRDYDCRSNAEDGSRYLAEGKSYVIETTLYDDLDYVLIASGNVHTKDMDIELYDENFKKVAEDDEEDNIPLVRISPKEEGDYYIKVIMYKGKGYSNLAVCFK